MGKLYGASCEWKNMSLFDTVRKEKVQQACKGEVWVLRQGTVEIHCSNGCGMSRRPSSVADRWFGPTGSDAMLLRNDTRKEAGWLEQRADWTRPEWKRAIKSKIKMWQFFTGGHKLIKRITTWNESFKPAAQVKAHIGEIVKESSREADQTSNFHLCCYASDPWVLHASITVLALFFWQRWHCQTSLWRLHFNNAVRWLSMWKAVLRPNSSPANPRSVSISTKQTGMIHKWSLTPQRGWFIHSLGKEFNEAFLAPPVSRFTKRSHMAAYTLSKWFTSSWRQSCWRC